MSKTSIEWTGETWNPTVGCDRISGSKARVIAEHQDEYKDLPAVCAPALVIDGLLVRPPQIITRWAPTDAERAALLRGEDVFVTLISNGPIHPLFVTIGPVDWT